MTKAKSAARVRLDDVGQVVTFTARNGAAISDHLQAVHARRDDGDLLIWFEMRSVQPAQSLAVLDRQWGACFSVDPESTVHVGGVVW